MAAPATRPAELAAVRQIEAAMAKAAPLDDPRPAALHIAGAAVLYDPVRGLPYVLRAGALSAGRGLPPTDWNLYLQLAKLVAPQDLALRDEYLRRGIEQGGRSLAHEALWVGRPPPPGSIPFMEPQKARDQARLLLGLDVGLMRAVLACRSDPAAGVKQLADVFTRAGAAGHTGGDAPASVRYLLWREAAQLDPDLLVRVPAEKADQEWLAQLCSREAFDRHLGGRDDAFTRALVTFAIENGGADRRALLVYRYFDLEGAWDRATRRRRRAPGSTGDPDGVLEDILVPYAWKYPDEALAVAEAEPDADARRELLDDVAWVWAFKRPDDIERAIRNQDNESRRQSARDAAAAERAHRRAGNPPRDSPDKLPATGVPSRIRDLDERWDDGIKAQRIDLLLKGLADR